MPTKFSSLRYRLLLPLWIASIGAAGVVALLSLVLGRQWAMHDVHERFAGIKETVVDARFPLTASVVKSLSQLSGTDLISAGATDLPLASTLNSPQLTENALTQLRERPHERAEAPVRLQLGSESYLAFVILRPYGSDVPSGARRVLVLFNESQVNAASRRAGILPLATGLSTIALITTLMIWATERLARRLQRLQQGVQRIASGEFASAVPDTSTDEVGQLGRSVNLMATELRQLWLQVNQQQGSKLLHQMASGMAHQLRNTLTGARLALELHRQNCQHVGQEELEVALREMEFAEDYVQRLLMVGAGQQQPDQPGNVLACLQEVCASQMTIAKHLHVKLDWECSAELSGYSINDTASLAAAVTNLVQNAVQVATHVVVRAHLIDDQTCQVTISDDGPGVDPTISDRLFEPFVSSKPEGIGLGLAVVQRAAEKLSGQVRWKRESDKTRFEFCCKVARV